MSKQLIEQLARQDKYWQSNRFNWMAFGEDLIKAYQDAAPIDNVAAKSSENVNECSAMLPNGKTCTNVYEAYDIGMKQAIEQAATAMQPMLRDMISRGDAYRTIKALIPDTQANKEGE
jgi:hypothetical protein